MEVVRENGIIYKTQEVEIPEFFWWGRGIFSCPKMEEVEFPVFPKKCRECGRGAGRCDYELTIRSVDRLALREVLEVLNRRKVEYSLIPFYEATEAMVEVEA